MADSAGAWGQLVAYDSEAAEVYDGFEQLPDPGQNAALDAFVARKHISHAALVRVGARLAEPTVLAFAGPGWLKFRDIVSGRRWSYAGCDWTHLRIVRAGLEPTAAVIVAEGETDSARLSDAYSVDVALMPAGAKHFPPTFAEQLRGYAQVLVGLDADAAGEEGAARILELLPQAQRFAPPANDWCEATELPPLPEPERRGEMVGSIAFEDLESLLAGGVPDPEVLVDDLLYTEGVHWMSGHPGSGKTTLSMHLAIMVMLEGRHVVWLDYEGGLRPTIRRLLACGCDAALALSQFHYAGWPEDANKELAAVAARWPDALIVLDSASKALQGSGLDENSPSEVTKWAAPVVKAAKTHRFPMIVIDHVTKVATRTSRYSRGAGSKMADADLAWFVETLEPFNRDTVGTIGVFQQKDREGFMPYASWYQVGDGRGGLPILPVDEPTGSNAADEPAI